MPGEQKMTDQEVIATWMEPRPNGNVPNTALIRWWNIVWPSYDRGFTWEARLLTLNECHRVEAKLSDEDKAEYDIELQAVMLGDGDDQYVWHATAEQKIRALAAVLRPVVEGNSDAQIARADGQFGYRTDAEEFEVCSRLLDEAHREIIRLEGLIEAAKEERLSAVPPTYCANCGAVNLKGDLEAMGGGK